MRVTVKGQVTIPVALRRKFGIEPDTEVQFKSTKEGILLTTAESAEERFARWVARARGSAATGLTTDEIMKLTRGED
jgi:antitoxin PrlF